MAVRRTTVFLVMAAVGLLVGGVSPASAQNLVINPELDTNASGWTLLFGSTFDPTHDFASSPSSGSILNSSVLGAGAGPAIFRQCITGVTAGTTYNISAQVLISAAPPGSIAAIDADSEADNVCNVAISGSANSAFTSTVGSWQTLNFSIVAAPGVQAIDLLVQIFTAATPGTFTVNYDHLSLQAASGVPTLDTSWLITLTLCLLGVASAMLLRRNRNARS